MTVLDGIWLAVATSLGLVTLFTLRLPRPVALVTISVAAALSLGPILIAGPHWQGVPAYLLILLSAAILLRNRPTRMRWPASLSLRVLLLVLLGATGLAWVLPPVPVLPAPTGRFSVATSIFRLVDSERDEPTTELTTDKRNVVVQAWYPADADATTTRLPYMDGLGHLPDSVSFLPSVFLRDYGQIDTHASAGTSVSLAETHWPVVLFSPGYGAPRFAYTALLIDLASRGFIVFAIDHPYEAALTELADGRLATPVSLDVDFTDDKAGAAYMARQQTVRRDDLAFVLNWLGRADNLGPLSGRLDLSRIVAAGHSFGGATAAALAERDSRIRAAINIDGTPYGELVEARLPVPFLLIQSDYSETGHSERFIDGNGQLLANAAPGSARHELKRANHYSFTDLPLYFSPPARCILALLIGGSRGVESTIHDTNSLISTFIDGLPRTGSTTADPQPMTNST